MCAVTRQVRPLEDLIRFVAAPDHILTPDLRRRLPGRGISITARRDIVARAVKKGVFSKGLKTHMTVAPTLPEDIDALLVHDALQSLSIVNKAGGVITGTAKVEDAIAKAHVVGLIHASSASLDTRRKLHQALQKRIGSAIETIFIIDDFENDDLDLALGRSHVIHAALVDDVKAKGFLARWQRLRRYRQEAWPEDLDSPDKVMALPFPSEVQSHNQKP